MATRKPQPSPAPSLSLAATLVRTITEDADALATLASKLSAHVAAEGELCDQTTLPASIPVRTYLRACREGLIAGASNIRESLGRLQMQFRCGTESLVFDGHAYFSDDQRSRLVAVQPGAAVAIEGRLSDHGRFLGLSIQDTTLTSQ